jgi:hypothetical protein
MKAKNFSKKLTLNKKTVADLNDVQLGRVRGYGLNVANTIYQDTCVVECTEVYTQCGTYAPPCNTYFPSCPASCDGTCETCVTCLCYTHDLQQCN